MLRAKVVGTVINVLLTIDPRKASWTDAAGKRLWTKCLNGRGKQSRVLSDVKENNSKGQGF